MPAEASRHTGGQAVRPVGEPEQSEEQAGGVVLQEILKCHGAMRAATRAKPTADYCCRFCAGCRLHRSERDGMRPFHQPLVSAVEVEELFGLYSYELSFGVGTSSDMQSDRLTLIYGNNGSGKTTILKLLWHTLSPSDSHDHRAGIARTPFKSFIVHLTNGDVIRISKLNGLLVGGFLVKVTTDGVPRLEQLYVELPNRGDVIAVSPESLSAPGPSQEGLFDDPQSGPRWHGDPIRRQREVASRRRVLGTDNAFVAYLEKLNAAPYLLADDRQIYGDTITSQPDRRPRYEADYRPPPRLGVQQDEGPGGGVAAELANAISRVNAMIQRKALAGSVQGSKGSNSAYLGILQRAASTDLTKADERTREELIESLDQLAEQSREYSRYGLLPSFERDQFVEAVKAVPSSKIGVVEDVLSPFIDAQQARLEALAGTVSLVRTFTTEMNRFFNSSGKEVTYSRGRGLQVRHVPGRMPSAIGSRSRNSGLGGSLFPEQLSSGERQILLLLLNTLLAPGNTRLFLIDEPELSLNVKWQRQLMDAMLACTEGSQVQFIVATHSIEVVTGHRSSLARMISRQREPELDLEEEGQADGEAWESEETEQ
ncbi:AAA domain-containing protein, putative AbiEii toxin, Type IV TA system [Streptomyces sp. TLI_053]|uniref:AAA family ATPase n=1 Tax=Streptomyces sp. TLI_053 TaxID=1855352 RepID=UPI00087D0AA4|nr:AAA family ATPase [Streptomyces sp. TLI_053]SDS55059.1 AAA domain-containing protein, putative AbiEii toxin, Type IV TA system [Streptomyces sp. TLI_053]SDT83496.1 AAA domain-containing protein, putative AbiEii toxin, Type IV TA system [Streptomyces sp. TLI_053]